MASATKKKKLYKVIFKKSNGDTGMCIGQILYYPKDAAAPTVMEVSEQFITIDATEYDRFFISTELGMDYKQPKYFEARLAYFVSGEDAIFSIMTTKKGAKETLGDGFANAFAKAKTSLTHAKELIPAGFKKVASCKG